VTEGKNGLDKDKYKIEAGMPSFYLICGLKYGVSALQQSQLLAPVTLQHE
jgi:hypothetical protein